MVSARATAELVAGARQQQVASRRWRDIHPREQRHARRPVIEVRPACGVHESIEPGAHRVRLRKERLELQQQLPARLLRVVLDELLEVEDMRAEPDDVHRRDDRADAPLARLRPACRAAVQAHDHLLARVADAGPHALERRYIVRVCRAGAREPRCKEGKHVTVRAA